jgi:phosphocarrier protein
MAPSTMVRRELDIINRLGLHARAAAKFVTCASGFESSIQVERQGRRVNGKSIMGVMMLAAACGTRVTLEIEGPDEERAADALEALIADRFGEPE